jgi:peptidyl-prolyl cis-trans isomerase A (cyclophilin A)
MSVRSTLIGMMAACAVAGMSVAAAGQTPGGKESSRGRQAAGGSVNLNKAKLRTPAQLNEKAPDVYHAKFDTSKGEFVVEVRRDLAPLGADRFYNLVKNGYYDDCRFFRVLTNFMAQFGINGDPALNTVWRTANLKDDPVKGSNKRGFITFATGGPNTRTTQVFINFKDNSNLDSQGFAPFGEVVSGMDVVDMLYKDYGEGAPRGAGPDQTRVQMEGNAYLKASFPKLDYVNKVTIERAAPPPA